MSKPEATSQSLEEILASIRKSLTDESTAGAPETSAVPPATNAGGSAQSPTLEGFSNRLAGALNGAGPPLDDALADFFTHVPGREAPASPGNPPKPVNGATEAKDPFWFLTRGAGKGQDKQAAGAKDAVVGRGPDAPKAGAGEIKLSRPETLRPSLPPLFDADRHPAPPARAPSHGAMNGAAVPVAPAKPEPAVPLPAAKPASSSVGGREAEKPLDAAKLAPPAGSMPAVDAAPAAAWDFARPSQAAPAPRPATPSGAATPAGEPAPGAAAKPAPAAAVQNQVLEEMIAQLLEPVLVRWLDDNLPRMIEKIVRAEIQRAAAGRVEPKV
jgi:cell pole-organizing protein PopZ